MKRIAFLACLLVATTSAHAAWCDLKAGIDLKAAEQLVGTPLFGNRSRGGVFVNWVYDNGGYILFENGRVRFWQQPADKTGGAVAAVSAVNPTPAVSRPGRSSDATAPVEQTGANGMAIRW